MASIAPRPISHLVLNDRLGRCKGIPERFNELRRMGIRTVMITAAKAKARGYRSIRNLKAMVYLLAGKLDLRLPA